MAGGPPVILPADPWEPSDVSVELLQSLVDDGLLRPVTDPDRLEWIAPLGEPEPRPREGYVMSFVSFHECGLGVPADRFMWALPHYYGVELHNFNPNSIAQAAIFVAVRGVSRDCPPLGAVAPSLSSGAYHQADGHGGYEEDDEGQRLHSLGAPRSATTLHPGPAHVNQSLLVHQLVLPL